MSATLTTVLRLAFGSLCFLLVACSDKIDPLHIGSKDFTENMLLAEMMAAMIEQEGVAVQRSIPYGSTFVIIEALKQGRIDLYPEYNGTGLLYLGQPPTADGDAAIERVRTLFADLGLTWGSRFGFSNDYVLTMRRERAQALNIRTIGDLARLPQQVRFVVDEDFSKRPLDGLGALVRRYGLNQGPTVIHKIAEAGAKDRIVQALLQDDADIAELFRTDAQIEAYGLVVLEDDLRFFPVYEPAPLTREEALKRFPAVAAALAKLDGKITGEAMRRMNAEVDLNGQTVRNVALGFLIDQGLLQQSTATAGSGEGLVIAIDASDSLSGPAGRALRAARTAFPKRAIEVLQAPQPLVEVASGRARLGVVSAEAFFVTEGDHAVRVEGVEALGVVGYKLAHIITRRSGPASLDDVRRLGVGQTDSASDRTARMVLGAIGRAEQVTVISGGEQDLGLQLEAMAKGLVDALFVVAPEGDPTLLALLERGDFRLLPLAAWTSGSAPLRFSFLRPAQIRASTYKGQTEPVETVSAQMVLIGPPSEREAIGGQGPVTTGTAATQPLPTETVKQLNAALGTSELVDPALPTPPVLRPELATPRQRLEADSWGAIVNLAVLITVGYLFYLLIAEPRSARRGPPSGESAGPA